MAISPLIVANLTTSAAYAAAFVVEVYSDLALTTLVGSGTCGAVSNGSGGFVQAGAIVVSGLTYGATYYARAGVVAPVTGATTWSATDTIVMGTHTVPSGVTYGSVTLTATVSGVNVSAIPASVPTNLQDYDAVWVTDSSTPAATVTPNWSGNVDGAGKIIFFAGAAPGAVVHVFIRAVNTAGQLQTWTSLGSATVASAPTGTASGDLSGSYPNPTVVKVNGTSLAGLGTGLLKNTTGTGVPSIAVAADIPNIAESQVTNLTTDLAAKAPLASPALTGTPTAPTASSGTNTTQLATTAFVQGVVSRVQQEAYTYASDTGSANAYAVTLSPVPTLVAGSEVVFKAANANTGASTLAVNGGTATAIKKNGNSTALASGDISSGQIVTAKYDGTVWQVAVPGSSGGGSLPSGAGVVYHGTQNPSGGSPLTPSVVQDSSAVAVSSLAFSSNVTAGNVLVVVLVDEVSLGSATISDTLSNTWTAAYTQSGSENAKVFYALANASGATTVALGGYSPGAHRSLAVMEVSNLTTTLDGTATGAVGAAPGTVTTTQANSLAVVGSGGFHSATTWTPPAGWSITQANGNDAVMLSWIVATAAGVVTPTFTGSGISDASGVILAFKATNATAFTGGSDGDYYFRTDTNELFGPKASGSWPSTAIPRVTTFNGNSGAVTGIDAITTTGTSGAATLTGSTLNIPNYGVASGGDLIKISEQVLGSAAATVTFNSIAGTYRSLRLMVNGRGDTSTFNGIYIRFNNDSAANYDYENTYTGTTGITGFGTASPIIGYVAPSNSPAGQSGSFEITIPNYSQTTFWKNTHSIGTKKDTSSAGYIIIAGVTWHNTGAITRIDLGSTGAGNFAVGSTFTLYGMN